MSDFYERYRHMYEDFTDEKRLAMYRRVKKGDWLFTCKLEPLQFKEWDEMKKASDYSEVWLEKTQTERDLFFAFDGYTTLEGSSHSSGHCGLWVVTAEYAKWFIEKVKPVASKLWEEQTAEISYDELVERIATEQGVRFEGA